ncbi:MAG: type IV pilus biogenesis/stability protein PilW [Planctomycetota bacterium]
MRCVGALLAVALVACVAAEARADVLELADGRIVEGVAVRDGDVWRVASRFGVVELPAVDVRKHIAGPSLDAQIEQALRRLEPDDTAGRATLAAWLRDVGRLDEAQQLSRAVLAIDPEDATAHEVLGHVRFRGQWMHPDEAQRARGLERHGDRWYTPEEWRNADAAAREAAAAQETARRLAARSHEVRRLVGQLVSADPVQREEARKALRTLAEETGVPRERIDEALAAADKLVQRAREVRAAAAAGTSAGGASRPGDGGYLTTEIRDDFTVLRRPIDLFATTLGSSFAPVTVMLPEMMHVQIRTTVKVPVAPSLQPSR